MLCSPLYRVHSVTTPSSNPRNPMTMIHYMTLILLSYQYCRNGFVYHCCYHCYHDMQSLKKCIINILLNHCGFEGGCLKIGHPNSSTDSLLPYAVLYLDSRLLAFPLIIICHHVSLLEWLVGVGLWVYTQFWNKHINKTGCVHPNKIPINPHYLTLTLPIS